MTNPVQRIKELVAEEPRRRMSNPRSDETGKSSSKITLAKVKKQGWFTDSVNLQT